VRQEQCEGRRRQERDWLLPAVAQTGGVASGAKRDVQEALLADGGCMASDAESHLHKATYLGRFLRAAREPSRPCCTCESSERSQRKTVPGGERPCQLAGGGFGAVARMLGLAAV
jgi:hypothetical protein